MTLLNQQPEDDNFNDLLGNVPQTADPFPAIPTELKVLKRWCVYGADKVPYNARSHQPGNPIMEADQSTYQEALDALIADSKFKGVGFGLQYSDGYTCVDFDHCIQNGVIDPEVVEILNTTCSFCELSPSERGVHLWIKGWQVPDVKTQGIKVGSKEIYSGRHYLTCTGKVLSGAPITIETRDLTDFYERLRKSSVEKIDSPVDSGSSAASKPSVQIEQGGKALTTKLALLSEGTIVTQKPTFVIQDDFNNRLEYPSHSEADQSLVNLLYEKFEGDEGKVCEVFEESSLSRDKWTERADYRASTLKKAAIAYEKSRAAKTAPATVSSPAPVQPVIDSEQPTDEDDGDNTPITEDKLPDFPIFTGSLKDLSDAMSPDIFYPFKMGVAIAHVGLIRSGLDTLASEPHIQPRFYTALIAGPGRGKTAAINEVGKVMKGLSTDYSVFSSIDSGPALVDAFLEQGQKALARLDAGDKFDVNAPARILLSPDELKGLFEKGKITKGGKNTIIDELLKLFEGTVTGNRARNVKAKIHIENAHLGIVGGVTPNGYYTMWSGISGSSDGLQSRVTCIGIEDRKMPSRQRPPNAEQLAVVIPRLIEQMRAPGLQFGVDDEAFKLFDDWWDTKDQSKASVIRIDGIVKRLLIILARTNDVSTIGTDLMRQAISFGEFVIGCRDRYNPQDSVTWTQANEQLIMDYFRKHNGTFRTCVACIRPDRRQLGGVDVFRKSFYGLVASGFLVKFGKTRKNNDIYKLRSGL